MARSIAGTNPMLFSALIWRPLRKDWGRTLLSLLAIALGVAVVIAIRIANRAAIGSFQRTTSALAGDADLLASGPEAVPAALLPRLFPLNAQAETAPYLDRWAYDPAHRDMLEILGAELLGSANGLLLPPAYASDHRLKAGDEVALIAAGRSVRIRIAGILPAGSAAAAASVALLDLPAALAAFEPEGSPQFDGLRITLAPGEGAAKFQAALRPLLPAADGIATPASQVAQDATMLGAFRANLQALSFVSLLIGIFLIYNTVSISVVRRRGMIATVRALGAERRRVLALFLGEGGVLALAGGAIGLGLGWLLASGALALMQRTINNLYAPTASASVALSASDALWGFVIALAAGLVAAWAPARHAAGVRPAAALRPGSAEAGVRRRIGTLAWSAVTLAAAAVLLARVPAVHNQPWPGFASALAAVLAWAAATPLLLATVLPALRRRFLARGLGAPGLAAASLAGALRRSAVLTVAVATAIGVMLGVAIMVGSFRETVSQWLCEQLQNDVFVRAADWDRSHPVPLPAGVLAAAAATPGAAAVAASCTQLWSFRGQPIVLNTRWPLTGSAAMPRYRFLAGGAGPVIVSEPFARRFHLGPGSRLELDAPQGSLHLAISGVIFDYTTDRGIVTLDRATFERGFGAPRATEIGLDAAQGVSAAQLQRNFAERAAGSGGPVRGLAINENAALRAQALRVFDQTFRITYALEVITLLVAILGVGNTLLAVVLERAPEFAVLRFLGATRSQIRRLLLAEAGVVASLALAVGWGMGLVLAVILARVINVQSFGWSIQFHFPWMFLAAASAAVWAATLAAGWLPARAARSQAAPASLEAM
ncbi:MAG TPA: ABC transporter permease [Terriglobales bacterium]|nr:ABC transporter permease [Terriglobales bacterium]